MTEPDVEIIADSISNQGHRITTFRERFWRPVLAERNTHRVQAKNSASSRARSLSVTIQEVADDPATPVSWPAEKRGMQGGAELPPDDLEAVQALWRDHAAYAVKTARLMKSHNLHKSVVNRLLEPFMMHTAIVTGTAWENYFDQRCDEQAQPEIRALAIKAAELYDASVPVLLEEGEWHLPFVSDQERREYGKHHLKSISAARCASVSYGDKKAWDADADLSRYLRLVPEQADKGKPIHWSPLEHVATPWSDNVQRGALTFGTGSEMLTVPLIDLPRIGCMVGWRTFRTEQEAVYNKRTYR